MFKYILRRVFQMIPLLFIISFIVFSLIYVAPFDAIDAITTPNMSQETIDYLRAKNGLDQPFLIQYLVWVKNIIQGDFGNSIITQTSINAELSYRILNTVKLMLPAYIISFMIAILLGLLAASRKGGLVDRLIDGLCSIGIATPTFWFAMIMIYVLGYKLDLFPIIGMYTIGQDKTLLDFLEHLFMPCLVLVVALFPGITRYVRSAAIGQLSQDYIVVQKSLGASQSELFLKHVSRNVLLPIVTSIGQALPMLVTGATITESIFQWPGVGSYFMQATKQLDYPVIMAVMLLSATLVIIGNLLSDILYAIVDPRIRMGA